MDVFKLAFETIVVGLLAFLWLGVATYLLSSDFLTDLLSRRLPAFARDNQTFLSVGVLTVAYCLGSAILPIATQLLNDEHWPFPENAIRCQVFTQQQILLNAIDYTALPKHLSSNDLLHVRCSYWAPVAEDGVGHGIWNFLWLWAPSPFKKQEHSATGNAVKKDIILSLFQLQESRLLNQATDTAELLRQLHERIVVLRGTVFSGFLLSLICLFAYFAPAYGHPAHRIRTVCGTLLAICFAIPALLNGWQDLLKGNIFDIPVLEGLVVSIITFGAILVVRGVKTQLFLKKRYLFTVIFFTAFAYAGWLSSEILYDQQVISSFATLKSDTAFPEL
jgi:hypothetical protein